MYVKVIVRAPQDTNQSREIILCTLWTEQSRGQVFVKVIRSDAVISLPQQINCLNRTCGSEESHVEAEYVTNNVTSFKTT